MEIFGALLVFVTGLCFGSFINMLLYRTARSYGLEKKNGKRGDENYSYCDYCGRRLSVRENIPVMSWLVQKGLTRCCQKKLPLAYPIVELATGISLVLTWLVLKNNLGIDLGNQWQGHSSQIVAVAAGMLTTVFLLFSALFDLKYMILPDFSTTVLVIISGIWIFFTKSSVAEAVVAGVGAVVFLAGLHVLTRGRGMGMGDVKFAAVMGLLLGYKVVLAMYLAFIAGSVTGLGLMLMGRAKRDSQIPFGPFLIGSTMAAWWWGDGIVEWLVERWM